MTPRERFLRQLLADLERKAAVSGVVWSARRRCWVSHNVTTGPVLARALNDVEADLDAACRRRSTAA